MWYFIRWTSDIETLDSIKTKFLGQEYLISKEYSRRNKLHFHIVLESNLETKPEINDWMYANFAHEKKGVSTLFTKVVGPSIADLDTVTTYSVKDNDFIHSTFFDSRIQKYIDNSYQKPTTIKQAYKDLISECLDDERPNFKQLWVDLVLARSSRHMEVYPTKITALVLGVMINEDNNIAYELVENVKLFS